MRRSLSGPLFSGAVAFAAIAMTSAPVRAEDLALDLGGATLELRRIPKGTFTQGSPQTEAGREADETPRPVTITRSFMLGRTPVTRGQFSKFVTETRYVTEAEKGQSGGMGWDGKQLVQKKEFTWRSPGFSQGDGDPVVLVTFGDANAFVAWASRKTGKNVRLPTEAEWEYAARAGTTTPWWSGTTEEDALGIGWFKTNAGIGTRAVAQKRANAFGLDDVAGNVFEWCADVYAPYAAGPSVDPVVLRVTGTDRNAAEPERRVLRGGSWLKDPKRGRSAARYRNTPGSRNADNGFRIAVSDDDLLLPGGATSPSFAPSGPVGLGSSGGTTSGLDGGVAGADASADATKSKGARGEGAETTMWPLLAAPLGAAAAVVTWMLLRLRKRDAEPGPAGISTRTGADGFWIVAPNLPRGTRVRYACIVSGVEVGDVVPLDGDSETFVYTGNAPSAVRITEALGVAPAGYRAPATPRPSSRPARMSSPDPVIVPVLTTLQEEPAPPSDDDDSSFLGAPRAY